MIVSKQVVSVTVGEHVAADPTADQADGQSRDPSHEHGGHVLGPDAAGLDHLEPQLHQKNQHGTNSVEVGTFCYFHH